MSGGTRARTGAKKPVNGNAKGKAGERELANLLTELGYPASRGQQFKGGSDSPDVVCEALAFVHWEVKRYATCQIFSPAMVARWDAQALADGAGKLAVVAHRWNGSRQWWVRLVVPTGMRCWATLEDFLTHVKLVRSEDVK